MRVDLDHLPDVQQAELARVRDTLMAEFAQAISTSTQPWKKNGKILKIILFGSYARDDWVDEPDNGYQSDFDLLVIVSHEDLTDIAAYWYIAEDKILHDPAVQRPVNIIVHTLNEVNQALQRGEYFWVDIVRDGVVLYELPQHSLAAPKPLTTVDALTMAREYFDHWLPSVDAFVRGAGYAMADGDLNKAAFDLHQATERLYICFLLVRTLYFPRSHNIKFLRSLSEDKEPRLVDAWPRATRLDRRRFELLKRAYVEARYSPSYVIRTDDLAVLAASVSRLRNIVEALSLEQLEILRSGANA
ncbi:HEPN domain-containing protein [Sphingomonas sp. R-74633]|uniref:HEPN domain-containing protein n=1 Tax=Sphingomonas sp. R-74633 TaxID=2751188 RepID=UPI0015D25D93|nr:HEPN domain-containing protein [Sphingomonas sp. R-74633]NYT40998.1 HEPN domain-containing protein [Sphingomonas sp. R-74633]